MTKSYDLNIVFLPGAILNKQHSKILESIHYEEGYAGGGWRMTEGVGAEYDGADMLLLL